MIDGYYVHHEESFGPFELIINGFVDEGRLLTIFKNVAYGDLNKHIILQAKDSSNSIENLLEVIEAFKAGYINDGYIDFDDFMEECFE
jgi:hypothetical protein